MKASPRRGTADPRVLGALALAAAGLALVALALRAGLPGRAPGGAGGSSPGKRADDVGGRARIPGRADDERRGPRGRGAPEDSPGGGSGPDGVTDPPGGAPLEAPASLSSAAGSPSGRSAPGRSPGGPPPARVEGGDELARARRLLAGLRPGAALPGGALSSAQALAFVQLLRETEDPRELEAIARVLQRGGTQALPEVREQLEQIALGDPSAPHRAAAAEGLLAEGADPKLIARLAGDPDATVRQAVVAGLAQYPPASPEASSVLLDLATKDADAAVRHEAAGALEGRVAGAGVDSLLGVARADEDRAVRQAAVQALGDPPEVDRARVLEGLSRQLGAERDPALRRTLLVTIVRVGRASAIPCLEGLVATAPDLADDAREWLVPLRAGTTDMDEIWRVKKQEETARLGPARSAGKRR